MDELPVKPYIPPAAGAAGAMCAVAALLLHACWQGRTAGSEVWLDPLWVLVAIGGGALLFSIGALMRASSRRRLPLWLMWMGAGVIVAACTSMAFATTLQAETGRLGGPASSYTFVVTSEPSEGTYGISCTADAYARDTGTRRATVRLTAQEAFSIGARLHLVGRIEPLDDSDWARSRLMRGEVASVDVVHVNEMAQPDGFDPIRDLRAAALAAIDPAASAARALVAGTVCGSTAELAGTDAQEVFARTGLSHLVAVSGSHLALIASFVERALGRTRVRRTNRFAIIGGLSIAYVVFTGGAPSAVRSAAMVCASFAAQVGRRRGHGISALALSACGFVALRPGVVYDLGFQLSATSVLFIQLFGRYLAHLIARMGAPAAPAEALSLTLAAQWATLPLTLPIFGELSLVAPLANLVVGPLMSALLLVGLIATGAAAIAAPLAPLLEIPCALARLSIFVAELLGAIPLASVPVAVEDGRYLILYAVAAAVYLAWPDPGRIPLLVGTGAAAACGAVWLVRWLLFAPASITVLDVGQADAILVRDGSSCILMDAGVDEVVVEALARNRVFELDAVVISHWDRDHWGGLPAVLETIPVDRVLVAAGAADAMPEELAGAGSFELAELRAGDVLSVGGFTCEVVWPRMAVEGSENADSLVLDVQYDADGRELSALLTGDTERDQEHAYVSEVGDIDVLKLGHHGSAESVDAAVLDALTPEIAIASAGAHNAYGHPTEECIGAVRDSGAAMLCTKDVGDVTVEPAEGGVRVITER